MAGEPEQELHVKCLLQRLAQVLLLPQNCHQLQGEGPEGRAPLWAPGENLRREKQRHFLTATSTRNSFEGHSEEMKGQGQRARPGATERGMRGGAPPALQAPGSLPRTAPQWRCFCPLCSRTPTAAEPSCLPPSPHLKTPGSWRRSESPLQGWWGQPQAHLQPMIRHHQLLGEKEPYSYQQKLPQALPPASEWHGPALTSDPREHLNSERKEIERLCSRT